MVADPDSGGSLRFEVDQGPARPWTYGAALQYSARRWLDVTADFGADFRGGWYFAIAPCRPVLPPPCLGGLCSHGRPAPACTGRHVSPGS
jgi:hypothetical protein